MSQNPIVRRAYVVRPRKEFFELLTAHGLLDFIDSCKFPVVVMTDTLPYEDKLEGYRGLIFKRCKERYLDEEIKFMPLSDGGFRSALIGQRGSLLEAFDTWWEMEEAETLEIKTDW